MNYKGDEPFPLNDILHKVNSLYLASKQDFNAVEEGLSYVWHPKMRFVFKEKSRIANTVVVSYDSEFIYLWSPKPFKNLKKLTCNLKNYYLYKIPHRLTIKNEWQYAWCAGIWDKKIEDLLPSQIQKSTHFEIPRISGGLLTPFIELQKKIKGEKNNPYMTRESYLATIIHEFSHIYWNSFKMWWPSNKNENLDYLRLVINLYSPEKKFSLPINFLFHLPIPIYISEVFAFCTEYYASNLFWKNHKKISDLFTKNRINTLITLEKERNLDKENSVIEPTHFPHDFASILGKIILTKYPNNWPETLTIPSFIY